MHVFLLRIGSQEEIDAGHGAQHRTVVANTTHKLDGRGLVQTLLQAGNQRKFTEFANQHGDMGR